MIAGALDIGSNSIHLLISEITDTGVHHLQRYKQKVQLGAGLDADNNLSRQAIDRGLTCLRDFVHHLNSHRVETLICAATNTIRVARNRAEFTEPAEGILMCPVDIITGDQEARLIFLAIATELARTGTGLAIDIGGGSTELAIGDHTTDGDIKLLQTNSLQMGCVSYSRQFFFDGKIYQENTQAALTASRLSLESVKQQVLSVGELDWRAGTSGTIQSIGQLCHDLYGTPANQISREGLEDLLKRLILLGHVNAISFPTLEHTRRPILPAGLCICLSMMRQLQIEEMAIGKSSLCEGLLIDRLTSKQGQASDNQSRTAGA